MNCKHERTSVTTEVSKMDDIGKFMLDIQIRCADCETPFLFSGLPVGLDLNGATMSVDRREARLSIHPAGETPPDTSGPTGFNISFHGKFPD